MKRISTLFFILVMAPMSGYTQTALKSAPTSYSTQSSHQHTTNTDELNSFVKGDICKDNQSKKHLEKCGDDLACLYHVSVALNHCQK